AIRLVKVKPREPLGLGRCEETAPFLAWTFTRMSWRGAGGRVEVWAAASVVPRPAAALDGPAPRLPAAARSGRGERSWSGAEFRASIRWATEGGSVGVPGGGSRRGAPNRRIKPSRDDKREAMDAHGRGGAGGDHRTLWRWSRAWSFGEIQPYAQG